MKINKNTKKIIVVVATALVIASGTFLVSSIASNKLFQHVVLAASEGSIASDTHQASWFGGHHGRHGKRDEKGRRAKFSEMSDEDIQKMVTRMVKHAAIEIEATEEQETKIIEVVVSLANDLRAMDIHKDMHKTGEEIQKLLLEDNVNRGEIEKMRASKLKIMDEASKRVTMAIVDVAEVLEPEQRKMISERIQKFGSWSRGGRHSRHHGKHRRGWWRN